MVSDIWPLILLLKAANERIRQAVAKLTETQKASAHCIDKSRTNAHAIDDAQPVRRALLGERCLIGNSGLLSFGTKTAEPGVKAKRINPFTGVSTSIKLGDGKNYPGATAPFWTRAVKSQ